MKMNKLLALYEAGLNSRIEMNILTIIGVMVLFEKKASLIATASGDAQKEAFFSRGPRVTLHEETEWSALVAASRNRRPRPVTGAGVPEATNAALGGEGVGINPYRTGNASSIIVVSLVSDLAS